MSRSKGADAPGASEHRRRIPVRTPATPATGTRSERGAEARPTGNSPLTSREKFAAVLAELREGTDTIASAVKNLQEKFPGIQLTREEVYRLLRLGLTEGYISLEPDRDSKTEDQLKLNFGLTGVTIVPSVYFPDIAMRAARYILELIGVYMRPPYQKSKVGIGFASGFSISHVARALATLLLETGVELPSEISFHALSVGFNPEFLREDPNFFMSAFEPLSDELRRRELKTETGSQDWKRVRFMGLYAPSIISTRQLDSIRKEMWGVKEAVAAAPEIDIVVTSASDFDDTGSTLSEFYKERPEEAKLLEKAGIVGHLLYLPLANEGPIAANKHEFILPTIWTLEQLHEIIEKPDSRRQHAARVVLVAGPTKERKPKQILYTILRQKKRLVTDLVTDERNGRNILKRFEDERLQLLGVLSSPVQS